jgi:hypothetical protein
MGTLIDLSGQRFGKIFVVSRANNQKTSTHWNYICDCNPNVIKNKTISTSALLQRQQKHCGCERYKTTINKFEKLRQEEIGQIYNHCKIINCFRSEKVTIAEVICPYDQNIFTTRLSLLKNGETKSCGCLYKYLNLSDSAKNSLCDNIIKSAKKRKIFFNLTKEEMIKLFQINCFYCNGSPEGIFTRKRKNDISIYIYNGIDRLDSNIGYIIENVVSACKFCNYGKLNLSLEEFQKWIKRICSKTNYIFEEIHKKALPWKINNAFSLVKSDYKEFQHSNEFFYGITQMNCHYCGVEPRRTRKQRKYSYTFNGIDRIDSNIGYELGNMVPCCTICNYAKNNVIYEDFLNYLSRLRNYQKEF